MITKDQYSMGSVFNLWDSKVQKNSFYQPIENLPGLQYHGLGFNFYRQMSISVMFLQGSKLYFTPAWINNKNIWRHHLVLWNPALINDIWEHHWVRRVWRYQKGYSESINRRTTYNTMAKRKRTKGQTTIHKTCTNTTKNRGWTQVLQKGTQFLVSSYKPCDKSLMRKRKILPWSMTYGNTNG